MSWSREFDDPIPLPGGRQLITLHDAGNYITKLPKAEHDAPEWQAAIEALMLVADLGGPTMFARIGVMRALTATTFASLTPLERIIIGDAESWCATGESGILIARGEVSARNGLGWPPIISHEEATLPTTDTWNRAHYGARHRYGRGRVRILWDFGLAFFFD